MRGWGWMKRCPEVKWSLGNQKATRALKGAGRSRTDRAGCGRASGTHATIPPHSEPPANCNSAPQNETLPPPPDPPQLLLTHNRSTATAQVTPNHDPHSVLGRIGFVIRCFDLDDCINQRMRLGLNLFLAFQVSIVCQSSKTQLDRVDLNRHSGFRRTDHTR